MQKNVIYLKKDSEMLSSLLDSIKENDNQNCCFFISTEIVKILHESSDSKSKFDPLKIRYTWILSRDLEMEIEKNESEWKMIYFIKTNEFEYKTNVDSLNTRKIYYSCEK